MNQPSMFWLVIIIIEPTRMHLTDVLSNCLDYQVQKLKVSLRIQIVLKPYFIEPWLYDGLQEKYQKSTHLPFFSQSP